MLDYLSHYQLVTPEKLQWYKTVFDDVGDNQMRLSQAQVVEALMLTSGKDKDFEFGYDIIELLKSILGPKLETHHVPFKVFSICAAITDKIIDLEKHMDPDAGGNLTTGQKLTLQLQRAKNLFMMCGMNRETGTVSLAHVEHEIRCGNLPAEETEGIIDQLVARGYLHFTFVEFLDFIPLFNRLHTKIVAVPLDKEHHDEEKIRADDYRREFEKQTLKTRQTNHQTNVQYHAKISELTRTAIEADQKRVLQLRAQMGNYEN
jgi:hypothetical protein